LLTTLLFCPENNECITYIFISLRQEISLKDPHKLDKLWEQIVSAESGIALGMRRYQVLLDRKFEQLFWFNSIIKNLFVKFVDENLSRMFLRQRYN